MDLYEALMAKALRSVMKPDHDAFLRHVKRFVSKTFHTSLSAVEDLDEEELLTAYYEETFEQMSDEDREDLYDRLTETDEERAVRERKERAAETKDDEFFDNLNREVASGTIRGPPKEKPKLHRFSKPVPRPVKEEKPPPPPPDIHMSFGEPDPNLPPEWAEMDPLRPPHKK